MIRPALIAMVLVSWAVGATTARAQDKAVLSSEDLKTLWENLADDDPIIGWRTMQKMARSPKESLTFLKDKLHPISADEQRNKRIAQLISVLDSNQFSVRQKAVQELDGYGMTAVPALRQESAKATVSLEVRKTIEQLIDKALQSQTQPLPPENLRMLRSIRVLEQIGTPEARTFLKKLASGDPGAYLTQEAQAALTRLRR